MDMVVSEVAQIDDDRQPSAKVASCKRRFWTLDGKCVVGGGKRSVSVGNVRHRTLW
jgi:hypothetical protein